MYRSIIHRVYYRHSVTVTNVPGPQEAVMIAKEQVKSCMVYVTHLHPILSMVSYDGQINITLTLDESAISDPHFFQSYYMKALALLSTELEIDAPASISQYTNFHMK